MVIKKKRTIKAIEKRLNTIGKKERPWYVEHHLADDKIDIGWGVYSNEKVDNKYQIIIGYGLTKDIAHFIANAAEDIDFLLNKLKAKK